MTYGYRNLKTKYSFHDLIVVFAVMFVFNIPAYLSADKNPKTTEELIEIGEKIKKIEDLFSTGSEVSIDWLREYLDDDDSKVRMIAIKRLQELGDEKSLKKLVIIEQSDPAWFVRAAARSAQFFIPLKEKPEDEIREYLTKHLTESPYLSYEIEDVFLEKNWTQELEEVSEKSPRVRLRLEPKIRRKSIRDKLISSPKRNVMKEEAVRLLEDWSSVYEYEESIIVLIDLGTEVIPDILSLLNKQENIPAKNPPPFDRTDTVFDILLIVLKSIPDQRSVPKLEELSKSDVQFVSQLAKEALMWVKSGVPYPYKYERIILMSDDDIPPGYE